MSEFSFTLEDYSKELTKVIVTDNNKNFLINLMESYDFEVTEHNDLSFFINENIKNVFEELTDYEVDDTKHILLQEDDDGFYLTPSDETYEILSIITVGDIHQDLLEAIPKRTPVVRGGKRKIIFRCGPGQMKVGRSCRRRPTAQLNKMKRRAKVAARKARSKRSKILRKRKFSMRKRAILIRKKPKHK